jgi:DNA-binding CsgD family transcriptional regulator
LANGPASKLAALAGSRVEATTERAIGIALALADPELAEAVRALLPARPELCEKGSGEAAVLVTDADPDEAPLATPGRGQKVLLVGGRSKPRDEHNSIHSEDPALILSAAAVLAAGYGILPEQAGMEEADEADQPAPQLSLRERQVASLLVEGASNKVIARRLNISVHTAKFHVNAVIAKLGAHNRSDAVTLALRSGVVAL